MDDELADLTSLTGKKQAIELGGSDHFERILRLISRRLLRRISAASVEAYCVGFDTGFLTLIAVEPHNSQTPRRIGIQDPDFSITQKLKRFDPKVYLDTSRLPELVEATADRSELIIWLFGRGEFFGFIRLKTDGEFSSHVITDLKRDVGDLLRFVAEENFAFRMNIMIQPFGENSAQNEIFDPKAIVHKLTRSFGADGSTLRLAEDGILKVQAFEGLDGPIIADRNAGDLVSGKIFQQEDSDWAAVVTDDLAYHLGGVRVSPDDSARLKDAGIYSLIIGCLTRQQGGSLPEKVGTLSYYFLRPHYFSERDLTLFRAFLRRVSDALSIAASVDEIKAQAALLESQSRRMTYVEVANLLAHDLWHKSSAVFFNARSNLDFVKTVLKSDRLRGSEATLSDLEHGAGELVSSSETLYQTSNNLHSIQIKPNEIIYRKEDFSIADVVDHVITTLKPALDQQKITVKSSISTSYMLNGPKFLFEQVIFNLVINSIDAAKSRAKPRPMSIEINAHIQQKRILIRYWDEGPGIDPFNFPNEQDVFLIGKTSKASGTGTGLPIARQLVGSHFKGNLTLSGRRPALFTIDVPLR